MRIFVLPLLVCVIGVAGCTTTSNGEPTPVPTSDATVESSEPPSSGTAEPGEDLPYAGAPKVEDPLDTTRFQQDPCQSLTGGQADELGVKFPGEKFDGSLGFNCEFRGESDRRALVDVAFLDKNPVGLSALYKANEDGKWVFFEELEPIEGHPAVAYDAIDQRDTGGCSVVIGASDEIAFEIALQLSQKNVGSVDPCEKAAEVAGMALQTMKAG